MANANGRFGVAAVTAGLGHVSAVQTSSYIAASLLWMQHELEPDREEGAQPSSFGQEGLDLRLARCRGHDTNVIVIGIITEAHTWSGGCRLTRDNRHSCDVDSLVDSPRSRLLQWTTFARR